MNIFYFTKNTKLNAKLLDDKRLVKMALETTQLLSNGLYLNSQIAPYKPTHLKHPCTIWTVKSKANWYWLKEYGLELCKEYTRRYNREHKCQNIIELMEFNIKNNSGVNYDFNEPPQCMPDKYKTNKTTTAYIQYYTGEKFNSEYFKYSCERILNFWKKFIF